MNGAVLPCRRPFGPSSALSLLLSLLRLTPHPSLFPPPPLHPRLNLLKRRCGLTVVISHHATAVLCVTSAQYAFDRSAHGHYESQHLGGPHGASYLGTCQYCHVLYSSPHPVPCVCVCARVGPREGFWGYSHLLDKPIALPSPYSRGVRVVAPGINSTRGQGIGHGGRTACSALGGGWLTDKDTTKKKKKHHLHQYIQKLHFHKIFKLIANESLNDAKITKNNNQANYGAFL